MPNRLKVPYNKKTDRDRTITVRFAPEPSGYLHIGHTRPLFLNDTIREDFKGKFILRFDDTNPKKESGEFEKAIMSDIDSLGIKVDTVTHTSDYFDKIIEIARCLVADGMAYMDCHTAEEMKKQRMERTPSDYRDSDVTTNLDIFDSDFVNNNLSKWCVRAKIKYDHINACLRDPVIMRACSTPHIKYGDKYSVYPTYDFCCPIVDSIEGVTHALRANEYLAHHDIYKWVCKVTSMKRAYVIHFAKICFEYTIMSKRYLKQMVEGGLVDGWDDPRLPTIRGLRNRGLTPAALRSYIIGMGMNNKVTLPTWDMLWATNKKMIDQIIPRYSSVNAAEKEYATLHIEGVDDTVVEYEAARHQLKKNLGTKIAHKSNRLLVNTYDSQLFKVGDRVGLLRNIVVEIKDVSDPDNIICTVPEDQSFKNTLYKINWLVDDDDYVSTFTLVSYGHLITKPTMDKADTVDDIFNTDSKSTTQVKIENCIKELNDGDMLQLERRGYYRYMGTHLVQIPEGRKRAMIN